MIRLKRKRSFMDLMVWMVFIGTFVFTGAVMFFVWNFGWENILSNLIDKWFIIMVSELFIMLFIQITKRGTEVIETKEEVKKEIELTKYETQETLNTKHIKEEDELDGY